MLTDNFPKFFPNVELEIIRYEDLIGETNLIHETKWVSDEGNDRNVPKI